MYSGYPPQGRAAGPGWHLLRYLVMFPERGQADVSVSVTVVTLKGPSAVLGGGDKDNNQGAVRVMDL